MRPRSVRRRKDSGAKGKSLISSLKQRVDISALLRQGAALALALLLTAPSAFARAELPEERRVLSIAELLGGASGYGTPSGGASASVSGAAVISYPGAAKLEGSARLIADYLKNNMGLNSAAVAGVLANIQSESEFEASALGDDGASFGICQWKGARRQALLRYCTDNSLDASTLTAQLDFLNKELTESYPETLRILLGSRNDAGGADNAAYFFCTDYEAPSALETELRLRCTLSREYFSALSKYESQELSVSQLEAELICADYLRNELGFNSAAAAGVLANIVAESGFNPRIVGDHGSSSGICQWSGVRLDRLIRFCRKNLLDENELYSQLEFLKYELVNDYPGTMSLLLACENTQEGARSAVYIFCKNYEAPSNFSSVLRPRTEAAVKVYYPMLLSPIDDIELLQAASDRAAAYIEDKSGAKLGSVCPPALESKLLCSNPRQIF